MDGPVPVRDTLKPPEPVSGREEGAEAPEDVEVAFELDGETWHARPAGVGAYGTGRQGDARVVAIHFYRAAKPDTPVREALVPARVFPELFPSELRSLFESAVTIDLERSR